MPAEQKSWLAAVGGFILLPMAASIVSRVLTLEGESTRSSMMKATAVHTGGALLWRHLAESRPQGHSFYRGGFWGDAVGAGFSALAAAEGPAVDKALAGARAAPGTYAAANPMSSARSLQAGDHEGALTQALASLARLHGAR